ncbi:MAG: cysteine hydrolase family protein [Chloroflexi bacterium]|nr:cysteine hydrolase family protein [Chloroflexota bacterium]
MREIRGISVLETLEEIADPRHTALLVIDIQNDNASPRGILALNGVDISAVRTILPAVKSVLEAARRLGLLIVFMRNTRSRDGSQESGPLMRGRERQHTRGLAGYVLEGTWGNEVLEELEPRQNERQMIKYRPSAFIGTPLDLLLKNKQTKSAVVVGQGTPWCVETTVRDLEQYGYYPVVLSDCVCTADRRELHQASLLVMSDRYVVVTSGELLKVWNSKKEA